MPESFGKRQRGAQRARKLAEREERRLARKQQKAEREASGEQDDWLGEPVDIEAMIGPPARDEGSSTEAEEESSEDRPS